MTHLECRDRQDQILLYVAGNLDEGEAAELRQHLAGGCPQCAGYRAEAEAMLGMLPLALNQPAPSPEARRKLLDRAAKSPAGNPIPISRSWDRIVLPASIAAVLAVAVTLVAVSRLMKNPTVPPGQDPRDMQIAILQKINEAYAAHAVDLQKQLDAATRASVAGMKYAMLTGPAQPQATGHVFIDTTGGKWYFFSAGMKPAAPGKTYELWVCCAGQKHAAGTFDVDQNGSAKLSGTVPQLPPGQAIMLAVTDEPAGGVAAPTGHPQIAGNLQ
ncbi:MAG: anti-sigma factor [Tepidisphaeraceae bacterium]